MCQCTVKTLNLILLYANSEITHEIILVILL